MVRRRAGISLLVLCSLSWVLVLAVTPRLHESVHADAAATEHVCAVTVYSSGAHEESQTPELSTRCKLPVFAVHIAVIQPLPSIYLSCRLLEHAPPA